LVQEFDIDEAHARGEVTDLVERLQREGLLQS